MALAKLTGRFLCSFSHHQYQLKALLTTTARLRQNDEPSETPEALELALNLETAYPALETPKMTSRTLRFPVDHTYPRLAWVESMDTLQGTKLGMLDLHPDIFAIYPRVDILHKNVHWQKMYRRVNYSFEPTRAEMPGGGKKPWPQKGLGKARHGSCRSPLWIQGAKAHGPRGPKSDFYMLPRSSRVLGLRAALSCKYVQNDLIIVDNFDIPTSEPEWLQELTDIRFWGYSVLFVDDTDIMPENMATAVSQVRGLSIMPAYGLNVYSMLKHETLVLTLAALEKIEGKLLDECHTTKRGEMFVNTLRPEDFRKHPKEDTLMLKRFTVPIDTKPTQA